MPENDDRILQTRTRTIAQHTINELRAAGYTLAAAESCTGGLITSALTDISGSSAVLLGGIVSYSNAAKMHLLAVPEETLIAHGAVSEATAAAMVRGLKAQFDCDYGVSVTGIAGPNGGTPEKPVGLVYVGMIAPDDSVQVTRHIWQHDRIGNKHASAYAALTMVLAHLRTSSIQKHPES